MTTYTTITNAEIDQDSPVTQPLMTALRDNPIAIAEGSSGAPKIADQVDYATATGSSWATVTDLDDYAGCWVDVAFEIVNGIGVTSNLVFEVSDNGSTFYGTVTLLTTGSEQSRLGTGRLFLDFATGAYHFVGQDGVDIMKANGTVSGASLSITDIRWRLTGGDDIAIIVNAQGGLAG